MYICTRVPFGPDITSVLFSIAMHRLSVRGSYDNVITIASLLAYLDQTLNKLLRIHRCQSFAQNCSPQNMSQTFCVVYILMVLLDNCIL